jgi:flagellar hook-basal body complex protein FliE
MPIEAISSGLEAISTVAKSTPDVGGEDGGLRFSDALGKLVKSVEDTGSAANQAIAGMVNKTGDVHDAMIALQRAEMQLQLTVQVRNKLVQAYNDIMRMPV